MCERTEAGAGAGDVKKESTGAEGVKKESSGAEGVKKESSGAGATLMKTKSSEAGAGATFMKRRAPDPKLELCYFYDGSAALMAMP